MKGWIYTQLKFVAAVLTIFLLVGGYLPGNPAAAAGSDNGMEGYVTIAGNGEKIPNPISGHTYEVKKDTATVTVPEGMVYIPAGSFVMGTQSTAHTVTLSAYCIGKFEVTNAEFNVFCSEMGEEYRPAYWGATDSEIEDFLKRRGNHPVLGISYTTGMAYCAWVESRTGWHVTLPSEAQWERAARGPTTDGSQYSYPWGDLKSLQDAIPAATNMITAAMAYGRPKKEVVYGNTPYWVFWPFVLDPQSGSVINQRQISHPEDKSDNPVTTDIDETSVEVKAFWKAIQAEGGGTMAVGSHTPPSPAGCYDMAGNAYEVTRDWYTVSHYIELAGTAPDPVVDDASMLTQEDKLGGSNGNFDRKGTGQATKVCRGGSWYAQVTSGQTFSRRETRPPDTGSSTIGFRVVAELPGK